MDNVKTDSYYIEKIRKDLEFIVDHNLNNRMIIDVYGGFLFYDENDIPLVAMYW